MNKRIRRPRYRLIRGDFYILYPDLPRNGPQPDGDTITFLPDNDELVQRLPRFSGVGPDRKHLGAYSVRFEGIDALETHFMNRHQELGFAEAARDRMLQLVGFDRVEFWPDLRNNVKSAEPHPLRGHLLANGIESNGRVVGLVYPGEPHGKILDGDPVFVDEARLEASVNAVLVREGLAYAELYGTMPLALVKKMRALITTARKEGRGLWPSENLTQNVPIQLTGLSDLPNLVMFPKLYRRLVSYFSEGIHADLSAFDTWIRADPVNRDDKALLPTGEPGNLHDLYDVSAGGIQLNFLPEDLLFEPDPPRR